MVGKSVKNSLPSTYTFLNDGKYLLSMFIVYIQLNGSCFHGRTISRPSLDTGWLEKCYTVARPIKNDAKIYITYKRWIEEADSSWHALTGMTRQKRKMHFSVYVVCTET